jgi:hypothetical protein
VLQKQSNINIDKKGLDMLFSGIDHYTDDMTWRTGITANLIRVLLIFKRTGKVLLIVFDHFVGRLSQILMFYKYNRSIVFQGGNLPD